jgi:uncharacterized membrane protein (UPF0182 family)
MPGGQAVKGPDQVNALINGTPEFSRQRSLLDQAGSRLVQGSLLLVPIEQSILYIRPLYVQATGDTRLPEFRFVAATYGGKAAFADSLPAVLSQLFPDLGPPPPTSGGQQPGTPAPPGGGPVSTDVAGLLAQAGTAYNEAQTALKAGNLADYQKAVDRMAELIRQAAAASGAATTTTTGPSSTTTTSR